VTALPNGWSKAEAGRLFGVVTSGSRGWAEHYSDVGPLFVRIGNMRDQAIDLSLANVQRVQPPSGAEGARTALRPGDILISITAEIGRVAIVPPDLGEAYVNQHIALARPQNGLCNEFLAWQLAGPGRSKLVALRKGATKAGLSLDDIRRVEVHVAPLNEQRRIVAKLDEVFAQTRAAKARLERLPALIDKLKRSILAAAFRGDLTADWRAANPDVEPASALLERIRAGRQLRQGNSQRRQRMAAPSLPPPLRLPSGWAWARLDEVARRITDGTHQPPPFTAAGVPFVFVRNIVSGTINLDTGVFISNETHRELTRRCPIEPGDVLYSAVGSYGIAVLVETPSPFTFQRHIAHIKPEAAIDGSYLRWCLNSPHCRAQADSVARGVAQKTVTLGDLSAFTIPVPPASEQVAISAAVNRVFRSVEQLAAKVALAGQRSTAVYEATLQRAFRGELVPQDPADEPAEVLLARLRAAKAEEAPVARRSRAAAPAPTYAAPPITLAQAAESGPLFQHALERRERAAPEPAAQDLVVAALQQSDGRLTAAAIAQTTGLAPAAVRAALKDLIAAGQVHTHGKARGTTYTWAG